MTQEATGALVAVFERVVALMLTDAECRVRLRAFAKAVIVATDEPMQVSPPTEDAGQAPTEEMPVTAPVAPQVVAMPPVTEPAARMEPLPKLTLGMATSSDAPVTPSLSVPFAPTPLNEQDLPMIEKRCRLKAEGLRWSDQRRQLMASGVDFEIEIAPRDRDIVGRAKELPNCFLWMCHSSSPVPADSALYEVVADCFDLTADTIALIRKLELDVGHNSEAYEQAAKYLAEAQSMLRVAVEDFGGRPDNDQLAVYQCLRAIGTSQSIYFDRFMRLDDPADPALRTDLDRRVDGVESAYRNRQQHAKQFQNGIKQARFHLQRIAAAKGNVNEHDWNKVIQVIDGMVERGVPPTNAEIRELLLPALDTLPDLDVIPAGFQKVLTEIDRFLANRPLASEIDQRPTYTAEVEEVARLLRGKSVVLIGGICRPLARQTIMKTFGLAELDWVETQEHSSVAPFESHVARPDVAVVVLAIRWSSHSYGEVRQFCERYKKPLVRLPAGYNVNQLAAQIMAQCGERLGV